MRFGKLSPIHLPACCSGDPSAMPDRLPAALSLCALQVCLLIAAHKLFHSTPCPGGVTAPLGPVLLAGAAVQLLPLALTLRVHEASPDEALSAYTSLLVRLTCRVLLSLHPAPRLHCCPHGWKPAAHVCSWCTGLLQPPGGGGWREACPGRLPWPGPVCRRSHGGDGRQQRPPARLWL